MYYFKRRNDTNPIVPKDNDVTHEEVTQLLIKTTLKNHSLFFLIKVIKIVSNHARSFKQIHPLIIK